MKKQQIILPLLALLVSSTAISGVGHFRDSWGNIIMTPYNLCVRTSDYTDQDAAECPSSKKAGSTMSDSKSNMANSANVSEADAPKQIVKKVVNLDGVNFKTGSNELTGSSLNTLDSTAQELKANPNTKIIVAGHTDNTGDALNNLKLSQARAEAVRDHLIAQGVGADQLVARGYGDTESIASNDTSEGRSKNRRVELRILK